MSEKQTITYEQFKEAHEPQLVASAVPERFYETLYRKLHGEIFDAGEAFQIIVEENADAEETDNYAVRAIKRIDAADSNKCVRWTRLRSARMIADAALQHLPHRPRVDVSPVHSARCARGGARAHTAHDGDMRLAGECAARVIANCTCMRSFSWKASATRTAAATTLAARAATPSRATVTTRRPRRRRRRLATRRRTSTRIARRPLPRRPTRLMRG